MLRHYGSRGTWSAGIVAILAQTARDIVDRGEPAPLLLDVGAAIGLVSIGVLRQAPGRALAIESFPETFRYLEHNVIENRITDRIEIKHLAVGAPDSANSCVRMERTPGNGGDSWIVAETGDSNGIPLVSLDELSAQYPDIPLLLKVDVQGYEPKVLAGGVNTFQRARLTVIEFWPFGIRRMGHDPGVFASELLKNKDSVALVYDEHRAQSFNWMSADAAKVELAKVISDGGPERQLEIVLK